jgi:1-acyl-sn-glycerol-3-phosphate acyltransferase
LALKLFYAKIDIVGKDLPSYKKATIILANHPNALIDPLLIACHSSLKPHFLTRASVFSNSILAKLLNFIRMIPVYRIRDGKENMSKNQKTFDSCSNILMQNEAILIFVEGNHSHVRGLRPLKRGFIRIIEQTLEKYKELEIDILPIGINYSNPSKSGSRVSICFGERIKVNDYKDKLNELIVITYNALDPLVTKIQEEDYDQQLQELIIHDVPLDNPFAVKHYFKTGNPANQRKESSPYLMNKLMKIYNFPVYLSSKIVLKKITDPVFEATFKFVIGLLGIPLWIFCLYILMTHYDSSLSLIALIMIPITLIFNKTGQG